jgi:hypothetical protein
MIEKIIDEGEYRFIGTLDQLKQRLGGFKITEEITNVVFQDIYVYRALAEFRYKSKRHQIAINSELRKESILNITYKGEKIR